MERKTVPEMNAPVRKPRLYARMLAEIHDCARDRGKRIAEISEDLRDHIQISGLNELESTLALIGTVEQSIGAWVSSTAWTPSARCA